MDTKNEIVLYNPNERVQLEVRLENETVWLTQAQIAVLFGIDRTVVTKHLKNIFERGELIVGSTCAKIAQVQIEGNRRVTRQIDYYNLDAILSVGYRVNSVNATAFRRWANSVLKEYLLRGYVVSQQIDFIVRTELPPHEGIFYDGQILTLTLLFPNVRTTILI